MYKGGMKRPNAPRRSDVGSWKDFVFDREAYGFDTVVSMGDGLDERKAALSYRRGRTVRKHFKTRLKKGRGG